jgi:hypothetical protein
MELFRVWQKYVILDGLCIVPNNSALHYVEHHFIFLLRYLSDSNTIKRLILGLLELSLMSSSQMIILSKSSIRTISVV